VAHSRTPRTGLVLYELEIRHARVSPPSSRPRNSPGPLEGYRDGERATITGRDAAVVLVTM
jgi:hypothetical protein